MPVQENILDFTVRYTCMQDFVVISISLRLGVVAKSPCMHTPLSRPPPHPACSGERRSVGEEAAWGRKEMDENGSWLEAHYEDVCMLSFAYSFISSLRVKLAPPMLISSVSILGYGRVPSSYTMCGRTTS